MKRFLVLIMASVFFASGMPPAESRAAEEYVLSLNLPIPPIHNRWHFALKQWTEEQMCIRDRPCPPTRITIRRYRTKDTPPQDAQKYCRNVRVPAHFT